MKGYILDDGGRCSPSKTKLQVHNDFLSFASPHFYPRVGRQEFSRGEFSHSGDAQSMGCISPVLSFFLLSILSLNVWCPLRCELYFVFCWMGLQPQSVACGCILTPHLWQDIIHGNVYCYSVSHMSLFLPTLVLIYQAQLSLLSQDNTGACTNQWEYSFSF